MLLTCDTFTDSSRAPYLLLCKSAALERFDGFVKPGSLKSCLRCKFKGDSTTYSLLVLEGLHLAISWYIVTCEFWKPTFSWLLPSFLSLFPSLSNPLLFSCFCLCFPAFYPAFVCPRWLLLNPSFPPKKLIRKIQLFFLYYLLVFCPECTTFLDF